MKLDPGDEIIHEFNSIRENPKGYASKVEDLIKNIQPNPEPKKGQNFVYVQDKVPKTMLHKGEEAFREMVGILNTMKPLNKLEIKKDLSIEVSENSKDWSNKDAIAVLVNKKKDELKDKYSNFGFHYDMGTSIPDVSAVLQLVDDNVGFAGLRRKNILNEGYKYIGVGYNKEKTKYCFYFLFAS